SIDYLRRVWAANGQRPRPGLREALIHFLTFGAAVVDKFGAWIGDTGRSDVEGIDSPLFRAMRSDSRGALLLSAHVGSTDVIRAIVPRDRKRPVNVIVHTGNAEKYNRLIRRFAPESQIRLIEATSFGMATAMHLSAAIERGELVVMMADRVSVRHGERAV